MKANELRIGNWVRYEGTTQSDIRICSQDIFDLDRKQFDLIGVEIKPILLTEEWLVKLGYRLDSESKYESRINDVQRIDRLYVLNIFDIDYSDPIECKVDVILGPDYSKRRIGIRESVWHNSTDIQYVHQLQNIYYSLTGANLEYTS